MRGRRSGRLHDSAVFWPQGVDGGDDDEGRGWGGGLGWPAALAALPQFIMKSGGLIQGGAAWRVQRSDLVDRRRVFIPPTSAGVTVMSLGPDPIR